MQGKPQLSQRGENTPTSPIRELMPLADTAKEQGIHIYHINIGDPDFPLSPKIKKSLLEFSKEVKQLPYPAFRGQKSILQAWKKYFQDISIPIEFADEEIIITAGATNALVNTISVITDPGDEVLVFEPFYAPYITHAGLVSAKLVSVALDSSTGFHLPAKKNIVAKITAKTKALLCTNPNNPTGTVFTRKEMELILEIAREHHLFVISDETYRSIVFDNRESLSMFHIAKKEDYDSLIIIDSLSKRLNVCGARIGAIFSKNKEFIAAAFRFVQGIPLAAYMEQEIVAAQLTNCIPYVSWLRNEYQKRRNAFISALKENLNLEIHQPEGAFYTMIPLPIDSSVHFAKWLLTNFRDNNETVMVSPGSGFYLTPGKGANEIRVAYVLEEKQLERAAELLALAVKEYKN